MQLLLTLDELQLVLDVLEQRSSELRNEIARTDRRDFKHKLSDEWQVLDEVENKLIRKEFQLGADELDALAAELGQYDHALMAECARTDRRDYRHSLKNKLELLQRVRDKITEACAMA
jgi:hypothetical protein